MVDSNPYLLDDFLLAIWLCVPYLPAVKYSLKPAIVNHFIVKFYCKTFVESDMNYNLIVIPLSSKKDFTLPTVYLS